MLYNRDDDHNFHNLILLSVRHIYIYTICVYIQYIHNIYSTIHIINFYKGIIKSSSSCGSIKKKLKIEKYNNNNRSFSIRTWAVHFMIDIYGIKCHFYPSRQYAVRRSNLAYLSIYHDYLIRDP